MSFEATSLRHRDAKIRIAQRRARWLKAIRAALDAPGWLPDDTRQFAEDSLRWVLTRPGAPIPRPAYILAEKWGKFTCLCGRPGTYHEHLVGFCDRHKGEAKKIRVRQAQRLLRLDRSVHENIKRADARAVAAGLRGRLAAPSEAGR